MNCPSRNDDTDRHPHWNQNPPALTADLTTRADLNGIANTRELDGAEHSNQPDKEQDKSPRDAATLGAERPAGAEQEEEEPERKACTLSPAPHEDPDGKTSFTHLAAQCTRRLLEILTKYSRFIGPGFLIAVAYIDPGNYATDVNAGAATRFAHLFIVLMSNLFAIFLQTLCIRLGSVTGLNLAENCRKHLPRWLVIILYIFSESAIIATDIAEVIGSAIALNLLLHIPLIAGCAITLVDVFFILIFYRPNGSMLHIRIFEYFVMALVLGVVVCFCIQLSYIQNTPVGQVFRGYLPSAEVVRGNGVYLSCGILGATVMPHSIFLGSGVVQSRLRQFDVSAGTVDAPTSADDSKSLDEKYRPSIAAIKSCLHYSVVELAFSLFTFALFINSAILITAGAWLYNNSEAAEADLFGIHNLLSTTIAPIAGTLFALALLLSGTSAGIVCTIAGQMVSEGMLNWSVRPWLRRLLTRSISIVPSVIVAGAVGRQGLNDALTASQVALSVILPFVTAPLIYFTCRSHIMTVITAPSDNDAGEAETESAGVNMRNGWIVTIFAMLIWLVLVVMNVALLVLVGLGKA
ncbi:hypothetical protein GJ744_010177 [Endocarpon pusillum]|uniref:Uncharacterized protein n=1 Tax=Endocarpon pusillum TaxID=364733 RepID=A0A8H7E4E1_9EURO|nr:hypothetical protein GJ744_010177 [Endocarpon pusillum]